MKDHLGCDNALYLDGTLSQFYEPGQSNNAVEQFGSIIGVPGVKAGHFKDWKNVSALRVRALVLP
jgi:hypothetical protein